MIRTIELPIDLFEREPIVKLQALKYGGVDNYFAFYIKLCTKFHGEPLVNIYANCIQHTCFTLGDLVDVNPITAKAAVIRFLECGLMTRKANGELVLIYPNEL